MSLESAARASTSGSHPSPPRQNKLAAWSVVALMALYIVFFSTVSIRQHRAFMTHGYDLGNVDQAVWNTLHGDFLRMTNEAGTEHRLGTHFDPILAALSPLYLLYSSPETLLIVQGIALALGAWPVFRLTAEKLRSAWGGVVFAFVYLMFPALQGASLSEFHAVTLGAGFLAWAFYSLHEERTYPFVFFAFLAMCCKEEVSLIVAMMGLYAFFIQKKRVLGLATLMVGLLWFVLAVKVVIPHFNASGRSIHLGHFSYLGNSLEEVVTSILIRPELVLNNFQDELKTGYLIRLCFPVGYLSLLAPQVLLIPAPAIAINFLSTHYTMYALDKFWGSVTAVPFIVISAGWGAAFLVRLLQRKLEVKRGFLLAVFCTYALIFTAFYHLRFGYTPFGGQFSWPQITAHDRLGQELADSIPEDATVVAQDHLNPHVSQRRTLYIFPYNLDRADYVFVDVGVVPGFKVSYEEYQQALQALLVDPDWGVVASEDGYILLQKGAEPRGLSNEFYDFARADDLGTTQPVSVTFGEKLRLTGLQIIPRPAMIIGVESYWQALNSPRDDTHIYIGLFDQNGIQIPGTVREIQASTWYPPKMWTTQETIYDQATIQLPAYMDPSSILVGFFVGPPKAKENGDARVPLCLGEPQTLSVDSVRNVLLIPAHVE